MSLKVYGLLGLCGLGAFALWSWHSGWYHWMFIYRPQVETHVKETLLRRGCSFDGHQVHYNGGADDDGEFAPGLGRQFSFQRAISYYIDAITGGGSAGRANRQQQRRPVRDQQQQHGSLGPEAYGADQEQQQEEDQPQQQSNGPPDMPTRRVISGGQPDGGGGGDEAGMVSSRANPSSMLGKKPMKVSKTGAAASVEYGSEGNFA